MTNSYSAMSQAAGAPPPPPPPPGPKKNFDDLPTELLLNIIRFLQINDYVKFTLAIYPILEYHGLVPPLTVDIFHRITRQQPPTPNTRGPDDKGSGSNLGRLPVELNDQIMDYLEPADRIAYLFSHRELFWRYFPALSEQTKRRLWDAIQRSRPK